MTNKKIIKIFCGAAVFLFLFFLTSPVLALCVKDEECPGTFCSPGKNVGSPTTCAPAKLNDGENCDRDIQCRTGACQTLAGGEKKCVNPQTGPGSLKFTPVAPRLEINIPTLQPFTTKGIEIDAQGNVALPFIGQYFSAIYRWALLIAGILTLALIIFGGFVYMTSGGNKQRLDEGKKRITQAILGLILLLSSYSILYIINPDLVNFTSLKLKVIQPISIEPGNETSEPVTTGQSKGSECFLNEFGTSATEVSKQLTPVPFLGSTFYVHKKMASALQAAAQEIQSSTYKITDPSSGSFNWRYNVNNPKILSLHSFAIAIDINPKDNPNYASTERPCRHDIPDDIINALKKHGFGWGGDYKSVCDAMHFEWLGPCAQ
ncbi:MAG: hypothetical protein UT86_C0005G0017 [Candidatus Magasanikbacteria bacterium GW2011_GWC2_40_17]|uniref:Peptidase M15C domain-containing protein n=1 Tax=Candidatus Magasanikbacteria bacterium GW2011_GWA2_42_32 TaxID=1619039 RepID=A0A0G1D414_9BACT|nr:MAG: hypothetical protein UT86_C0005G0017 [Candidatus Magasanikbacteria bacterium GW2011_GWC2_40_17]KKS56753.1 MAG: hypothetical protein UV20_C0006G0036 [Candidatus Magasanikbacteria bacterium GW2011_GWA2_42_32]OGH86058.1 MAG: hypothetical protein A2294_02235 [Candidatus Magasanikbacteria bacterium RIFOXYB2_FULL_38_10]